MRELKVDELEAVNGGSVSGSYGPNGMPILDGSGSGSTFHVPGNTQSDGRMGYSKTYVVYGSDSMSVSSGVEQGDYWDCVGDNFGGNIITAGAIGASNGLYVGATGGFVTGALGAGLGAPVGAGVGALGGAVIGMMGGILSGALGTFGQCYIFPNGLGAD